MSQIAHGTYLRSPIFGLSAAIHFHPVRQTFHSLKGTCYSEYVPTAPSKFYKSRATERPISISILHFSSLLSPLLHRLLPLALLATVAFFVTVVLVVERCHMLAMTR